MNRSPLQEARYAYTPKLPPVLREDIASINVELGAPTQSISDQSEVKALFPNTYGRPIALFKKGKQIDRKPLRVGVILSGGQAPGGHNVIAGIFDGLKNWHKDSVLIGFKGGPAGLFNDKYTEITSTVMDEYRNTGGFDIIGSGRDKIESPEQFAASLETAKKHGLSAVVVIGGDDSNTNAALLAEYFASKDSSVSVIGCPKTIDGDLKNEYIEASFGFDTATKTYAELIGNIQRDANSAKKYWHFIKLMGRSASHIALECALQCRPNVCLISEEIEAKKMTLSQVVEYVTGIIVRRADSGDNFGVALVPEGLIEFIPEMKNLISEINDILAREQAEFAAMNDFDSQKNFLRNHLTKDSFDAFSVLPTVIAKQLLMDRDPHGNVQVSRIETERLIIMMVEDQIAMLKAEGRTKAKFSALNHFFGYEGRCAFPSNFDSDYCYSLGYGASVLIAHGLTGYLSSVRNLSKPASEWVAGGIPLTMMMNIEQRHGSKKPVIKKALVELEGKPFKDFANNREEWSLKTCFAYPGSIQYYGPDEVCNAPTITLKLEHK